MYNMCVCECVRVRVCVRACACVRVRVRVQRLQGCQMAPSNAIILVKISPTH